MTFGSEYSRAHFNGGSIFNAIGDANQTIRTVTESGASCSLISFNLLRNAARLKNGAGERGESAGAAGMAKSRAPGELVATRRFWQSRSGGHARQIAHHARKQTRCVCLGL